MSRHDDATRATAKATTKSRRRGTRAGVPDFPDQTILAALAAWVRLGSSLQAAATLRLDDRTVRHWRERRPELWSSVVHAHEEALRDLRAAIAASVAEGLHLGADAIRERLTPEARAVLGARDLSHLTRALSDIDATQDRIRRLDAGLPTERVGLSADADTVAALDGILAELRR